MTTPTPTPPPVPDHAIADRWALYAANNVAIVGVNPDSRLQDAFYAGVYAGLELAGPGCCMEYAAYVATAMEVDATVVTTVTP